MDEFEAITFVARGTLYEGTNRFGRYFSIPVATNTSEGMLFISDYLKSHQFGKSLGEYLKSLNLKPNDVITIRKVPKTAKSSGRKFYVYEVEKD